MQLTLYHAIGACSFAPLVALEQANAPYELRRLDVARKDQRDPRYLAVNPLGRIPALTVGSESLTETPAIMLYIADAFPQAGLLPSDVFERARVAEIMAWIASSVHVALAAIRRPERYLEGETGRAELAAMGLGNFKAGLDRLEHKSAGRRFLVGDSFGAADIYATVVRRWAEGGLRLGLAGYPAFVALTDRALDQPATRRALEREQNAPAWIDEASRVCDLPDAG